MKTYSLIDRPTRKEIEILYGREISTDELMKCKFYVKAVFTGEKRMPRAGEWFLSGAIVEAYKTKNDLNSVFPIAKLVRVEKVVSERILV